MATHGSPKSPAPAPAPGSSPDQLRAELADELDLHAQMFALHQAGIADPQMAAEVAQEVAVMERNIVYLRQRIAAAQAPPAGKTWQEYEDEIVQLVQAQDEIRAMFSEHPGNPELVAMLEESHTHIAGLRREQTAAAPAPDRGGGGGGGAGAARTAQDDLEAATGYIGAFGYAGAQCTAMLDHLQATYPWPQWMDMLMQTSDDEIHSLARRAVVSGGHSGDARAAEEGVPPDGVGRRMDDGRNRLLSILLTSRVLQAALPDVRRRALAESVREATTVEAATDILLENVASSPFLPQERKDPLAELAMTHQFDALAAALQCDETLSPGASPEHEFAALRQMVVAVFTRSRKMQGLPAAKRRQLGAAIHAQTTADEIKMLALSALQTSEAFDGAARDMVANDILDSRYDRLLLPDRFDCDEAPRRVVGRESGGVYAAGEGGAAQRDRGAEGGGDDATAAAAAAPAEEEECPVCLGTSPISARLPCGHQFCRGCIQGWAQRCPAGQDRAGCPLCRAPFRVADIGDAILA